MSWLFILCALRHAGHGPRFEKRGISVRVHEGFCCLFVVLAFVNRKWAQNYYDDKVTELKTSLSVLN
jgi:hypothetical protein